MYVQMPYAIQNEKKKQSQDRPPRGGVEQVIQAPALALRRYQ